MKTIEEKAKAYDEAIKKAAALYKASEPMSGCNVIIETLFPELAESEDEKIKNRLIKLIKMSNEVGGFALHKWEADEMLAWLEKQGEKKPAWSEEDERILHTIIADFKGFIRDNTSTLESHFNECIDWLKSLRPQKQWIKRLNAGE